jgi:hypothetical protein
MTAGTPFEILKAPSGIEGEIEGVARPTAIVKRGTQKKEIKSNKKKLDTVQKGD